MTVCVDDPMPFNPCLTKSLCVHGIDVECFYFAYNGPSTGLCVLMC